MLSWNRRQETGEILISYLDTIVHEAAAEGCRQLVVLALYNKGKNIAELTWPLKNPVFLRFPIVKFLKYKKTPEKKKTIFLWTLRIFFKWKGKGYVSPNVFSCSQNRIVCHHGYKKELHAKFSIYQRLY